jgi:diguanylate cyclase (GGDEF)-like protein
MLDVHDPGDSSASINEGALPLYSDDDVVAIVCVEFSSRYANDAYNTAALNTNLLIGSLAVMMAVLFAVSVALARMNQRNQQHLFDMANKDVITGLPNRRYLFSYLADLFGQASPRQPDSPVVALFIDIDNFKAVNDGAGHDVGDHLLASIGGFLAEALSQVAMSTRHECLTARLGGDEFVQLLVGADMELATTYVCMLMERFSLTPDLLEYIGPYDVSLSIGIAACPEHATEFNDLVKFADIAMYHSKAQGKHSYTVYDPDMGHHVEGYTLSVREVRK